MKPAVVILANIQNRKTSPIPLCLHSVVIPTMKVTIPITHMNGIIRIDRLRLTESSLSSSKFSNLIQIGIASSSFHLGNWLLRIFSKFSKVLTRAIQCTEIPLWQRQKNLLPMEQQRLKFLTTMWKWMLRCRSCFNINRGEKSKGVKLLSY